MPVPSHRWWTYACCAVASLTLAGLSAAPAAAGTAQSGRTAARAGGTAPGGAAAGRAAAGHPAARSASRFNVGAAHSPQLLSQLAGPHGAVGAVSPGRAAAGLVPAGRLKGAQQGVDVAAFQHPAGQAINWAKAHAAGIGFAGVKATEGAYYRNPYALTDLAHAHAAGLAVAAYAFAVPNGNGASSSPVQQADYLLSYLGKLSRSVPIMLDIEYNPYGRECYGLGAQAMVSWISAFNREIKARTGSKPIMYIPASWWATCTRGHVGLGQRPLWVPYYSTTATRPPLPAGWATWSIWQYSSTGTVRGIPAAGSTDLDQANPAVPPVLGRRP
jgi:GH25 family lysozyme M1 (1,4-beta-N-acetylmuramidase)